MTKVFLLCFLAFGGIISCSKPKTSNVSNVNTQIQPPVVLANNNNPNSNSNSLSQSGMSQSQSEVNAEMLRKIEAQQLETADPRKAAKQVQPNNSQPPKKTTSSSGKQTW